MIDRNFFVTKGQKINITINDIVKDWHPKT